MQKNTATIVSGDRIRLVVLDVDFGAGVSTRVTRRYDWTGADPEHMCNADVCETCTEGAIRTARRRLEPGVGKATATMPATITLLRDGQSVAK
jgi:hypothetical protein